MICAAFYVAANIFYLFFGSGELQWWNNQNSLDLKNPEDSEKQKTGVANGNTTSTP